MFLIFDFDSICDGAEAGALMGVKLILLLVLIGVPLMFLGEGGYIAIGILGVAILFGCLYLNIVALVNAIKKIKDKRAEKFLYDGIDYKKLKKNGKIVLVTMAILTLLGLLLPLSLGPIKLSKLSSMILYPALFNIAFCFLLSSNVIKKDKINISSAISVLKEYMLDIFIGRFLIIFGIILSLYSWMWHFGIDDPEFQDSKLNSIVYEIADIVTKHVTYYDDKFEEVRKNNFSITESIEEQINYIKNIGNIDPDIYVKVAEYNQPRSNTEYVAQEYKENEPKFVLACSFNETIFEAPVII